MVGNQRLTAQAGAVLLVLSLLVILTAAYARGLLAIHFFIGVLFLGPLGVMIGSTGYRFLRYHMGSSAFVSLGRPRLALAVLAPLLHVSTFLVVASGLALLWTFPGFLVLHVFAALFWLPIVAIHAVAHAPRIPRLVADDWVTPLAERTPGRERRLGVMFAAVVAGVIAAILVQPTAAPMIAWSNTVAFGPVPSSSVSSSVWLG